VISMLACVDGGAICGPVAVVTLVVVGVLRKVCGTAKPKDKDKKEADHGC